MKIIRFIKLPLKQKKRKIISIFFKVFKIRKYTSDLRKEVTDSKFTIISNNCFAGSIYQDLKIPYRTPTVGLFLYSDCYMRFVKDLKYYLSLELIFIKNSKYVSSDSNNNHYYPIGLLDDIEIHFLHYDNEEEATVKWNKRKERVNYDQLYFVFSDRDGFNKDNFCDFLDLDCKKVLFTSQNKYNSDHTIILNEFVGEPYIGEITLSKWTYINEFSISEFLKR